MLQNKNEEVKDELKGKILEISSELVALAEQTNASVETLVASGYDVKEKVTDTTSHTKQTQIKAENGRKQMSQLIENIKLIAQDTEAVNQLVIQLEQSSEEIEKVTKMVKDIAEQTNLLALNSAIEAARAGEHGKGFAVVSNEVKKLAEQTKQSVTEIQTIVTASASTTEQVINSLQNVKQAVGHGIETSQSTDKTFEEIVLSMDQNTSAILQIDNKVSELVEIIKEIGLATNGVAQSAEHLNEAAKGA
ncbi:methyl-accepting chemotaxis protein [Bacillus salinus]|uniref:methyl-accepting chemotaxis protein n=1 Tax=Bacillus sp. HMF5848 TaxID=2495421 RepID=UPI0037C1866F